MLENREHIEELIVVYLQGEASPEQAMAIQNWLDASDENKLLYEKLERTYATSFNQPRFKKVDSEQAWNQVINEMNPHPKKGIIRHLFWYGVAASILVILSFLFFSKPGDTSVKPQIVKEDQSDSIPTVFIASNEIRSITLEDQSTIELTPGGKITLNKDFNESNRHLTLEGSGKFQVIHDASKPFIVHVKELEIIDIGTIFRVNSSADTIHVAVDEGEVELKINNQVVAIEAGDSAYYVISQKIIEHYPTSTSKKDHVFKFEETPLKDVAFILGEYFHKTIEVVNPELHSCKVNVTFKNEDLGTILGILEELLDLRIEIIDSKTIKIDGDACI